MEDDDLAPSQFKVEVDTAEETESVEECRTIIPGRGSQYLNLIGQVDLIIRSEFI